MSNAKLEQFETEPLDTLILFDHIIAIVDAAFALVDGFDRRAKEPGMGFVIPFPEATALLNAAALKTALQTGESK